MGEKKNMGGDNGLNILEKINDYIRESIPLMVFISWVIMICVIIRGLYTGAIR
jgi:hypothetical protein